MGRIGRTHIWVKTQMFTQQKARDPNFAFANGRPVPAEESDAYVAVRQANAETPGWRQHRADLGPLRHFECQADTRNAIQCQRSVFLVIRWGRDDIFCHLTACMDNIIGGAENDGITATVLFAFTDKVRPSRHPAGQSGCRPKTCRALPRRRMSQGRSHNRLNPCPSCQTSRLGCHHKKSRLCCLASRATGRCRRYRQFCMRDQPKVFESVP